MTVVRGSRRRRSACTLYRSSGAKHDLLEGVRVADARDLVADLSARCDAAVLVVDASIADHARTVAALPTHVAVVAADAASEEALRDRVDLSLAGVSDAAARRRVLRAACLLSAARVGAARGRRALVCTRRDLHKLNQISIDLMHEHDQAGLLKRIVSQGKRLTESDAGCLFLLEADPRGAPRLRPAVYSIDSIPEFALTEAEPLPLDSSSIIGHAGVTKKPIVIRDAYQLPSNVDFSSNVDFERRFGYYVQSMLVTPMLDHRDALVGVLAFVNRKRSRNAVVRDRESARRHVLPYRHREARLGRALASVAAASIENSTLYAQIQHILESFVKAAVSAIDQRDPSTAGHSIRVATLTTELARAVERGGGGAYRGLRFTREQMRELHFAALLHDLGKVGVRENVLMKAKKLPPALWERVEARFNLIRRTLEAEHYRACRGESTAAPRELVLDATCANRRADLERLWTMVRAANEPAPLACAPAELDDIAHRVFDGPDGTPTPYLAPEELVYLQIPHGTLDSKERYEIQSHVEQTYQFLLQIPWTDDLKNLARYARGHHEKLDGSGYPLGLRGDEIPVQTRLMTIADIFDALTASDRPYKKAVTPDAALEIIEAEARAGMLDADLVRVLVESQVYRQILAMNQKSHDY